MEIKYWQKRAYEISKSKGWYDPEVKLATDLERQLLMITEIAEACEEVRNKKPDFYLQKGDKIADIGTGTVCEEDVAQALAELPDGKPEGEAVELADAVIRIMDYFEHKGWDLETAIRAKCAYNETRPYRHGGKAV